MPSAASLNCTTCACIFKPGWLLHKMQPQGATRGHIQTQRVSYAIFAGASRCAWFPAHLLQTYPPAEYPAVPASAASSPRSAPPTISPPACPPPHGCAVHALMHLPVSISEALVNSCPALTQSVRVHHHVTCLAWQQHSQVTAHTYMALRGIGSSEMFQIRALDFTPSCQLLKCQSRAMRCGDSSVNVARTAPPKISNRPPTRGSTCSGSRSQRLIPPNTWACPQAAPLAFSRTPYVSKLYLSYMCTLTSGSTCGGQVPRKAGGQALAQAEQPQSCTATRFAAWGDSSLPQHCRQSHYTFSVQHTQPSRTTSACPPCIGAHHNIRAVTSGRP